MALYARVITAATVREPRSGILSRYKMCAALTRTLTRTQTLTLTNPVARYQPSRCPHPNPTNPL